MKNIKKLVTAGVCLALCLVLPFITGQVQAIGNMLLPMHLPVLLCGFAAGPAYAFSVGLVAPILRSLLFGMPPLMPTGLSMAFELASYGAFCGLLYQTLPKKTLHLYTSLIGAMIGGRIVWGIAAFILNRLLGNAFTLPMFFAGAFTNAIPGILCQLILIPPVVLALKKAKLIQE
ncbi:MAG: ECF transporter S component [Lachnospiraceae bacterium]|nr:ECF transporter S component [Lachnospiraceae bacterium]